MTLDEFLQHYQNLREPDSPCCAIVTHLEGTANVDRGITYPVTELIFLKWADPLNYAAQADAKAECHDHAWKFLLFLRNEKQNRLRANRLDPLAHVELDNVRFEMLGPITDGWFAQIVTLTITEITPQCYSSADYLP
jgi:hypothetical protein